MRTHHSLNSSAAALLAARLLQPIPCYLLTKAFHELGLHPRKSSDDRTSWLPETTLGMAQLRVREVRSASQCPLLTVAHKSICSEVFVIVSLTLFLPICLEQFARDNGYQLPDKTERCLESTRCAVRIGWMWVDTASFR